MGKGDNHDQTQSESQAHSLPAHYRADLRRRHNFQRSEFCVARHLRQPRLGHDIPELGFGQFYIIA
jgi:hypothetical protein